MNQLLRKKTENDVILIRSIDFHHRFFFHSLSLCFKIQIMVSLQDNRFLNCQLCKNTQQLQQQYPLKFKCNHHNTTSYITTHHVQYNTNIEWYEPPNTCYEDQIYEYPVTLSVIEGDMTLIVGLEHVERVESGECVSISAKCPFALKVGSKGCRFILKV